MCPPPQKIISDFATKAIYYGVSSTLKLTLHMLLLIFRYNYKNFLVACYQFICIMKTYVLERERNMQYYEEVKANNRMKYDSEGPRKIGEAFFVHLAFISAPLELKDLPIVIATSQRVLCCRLPNISHNF